MTASNSVVKLTAKTALKNNWLNSITACLTVMFTYFICILSVGYIGEIAGDIVATVVLMGMLVFLLLPLMMGVINFFWRMLFGAEDKPIAVFCWFSSKKLYKRALKLIISLLIRMIAIGLILFLPAIIVDVFSSVEVYDLLNISVPLWTGNLYYLSVFLKTAATVILLFVMAKYYAAPILITADENMEIAEAIHMSTVISKSTLLDFICFVLSFTGWFLTAILVFPLIFVLPYFITSFAVHTRFAIADYNKKAEAFNNYQFPSYSAEL